MSVWILDDDRSIRFVLSEALRRAGLESKCFADPREVLDASVESLPEVLFTDVRMPGMSGLDVLQALKRRAPRLPVVVMSAYTDMPTTAQAFAGGAFDYLPKPFDLDDAVALARRALAAGNEATTPLATVGKAVLRGESAAITEVMRRVGRLAQVDMPVLITGETGTGKELVARALHEHSRRQSAPFIALNTAAIASELLESELFGHEQGAFTGAHKRHIGRFEQASRGTLFLDEIGDMPLALQTRLLRVLAEGEFYRVGGRELVRVDVRILAATHQDLPRAVLEGRFRADLLHRLNVVEIMLPPLRARTGDAAILAHLFLAQAATEFGMPCKRLGADAAQRFNGYGWPGNIRQLENVCRRLTVLCSEEVIDADAVSRELVPGQNAALNTPESANNWSEQLSAAAQSRLQQTGQLPLAEYRESLEQALMQVALRHTDGDRQRAAQLLQCGRNTLTRKLGRKR